MCISPLWWKDFIDRNHCTNAHTVLWNPKQIRKTSDSSPTLPSPLIQCHFHRHRHHHHHNYHYNHVRSSRCFIDYRHNHYHGMIISKQTLLREWLRDVLLWWRWRFSINTSVTWALLQYYWKLRGVTVFCVGHTVWVAEGREGWSQASLKDRQLEVGAQKEGPKTSSL